MLIHLLKLIRPGDWTKSLFVLPPLVFSQQVTDPNAVGRSAVAFVAFCLASSGVYAINDVLDAESDRRHPIKRRRPVASGAVPPKVAVALGAVLAAAGVGAGLMLSPVVAGVLLSYLALQAIYNIRLKRVMLVDVATLALGFALRSVAGAAAIGVRISVWMLLGVFFLCMYLGFIKRLCDLASAERNGVQGWKSAAGYDDRNELGWLLGVTATLAVVTYLMYTLSGHAWELFGPRAIGFALLTPLVLIAVHRFYRRAAAGVSDSPFDVLRHDRALLAAVFFFAAGTLILQVRASGDLLKALFYHGAGGAGP